jgi:hypothetical protein
MAAGQIALNTASGSPGLFFVDSANRLVKVGPVHVGSGAPNASPASGGASGNTIGEQWLDTSGGNYLIKTWDGSDWRSSANDFINASGDTMTGPLVMGVNANIVFEGSVDDGFETTLTVANPTADQTITFPNITGTVITTGDTGTVTSAMIASGTIIDADVNASAAIAGTKISPNFGSQNAVTTGSITGGSFIPTSTTTPANGLFLPATNGVGISTNSVERLRIGSTGAVAIGSTTTAGGASGASIRFANALTGSVSPVSILGTPVVQNDAITAPQVFSSNPSVSSGSFTVQELRHFNAIPGAFGSGATVTSQMGFYASAAFSGATNNYGFYSAVPGGTGNFAFFAAGTADSYFVSNNFIFANGGTERARVDSSGRLLVGTSSSILGGSLQIGSSTGTTQPNAQLISSNDAAYFWIARSNAGAAVADSNNLGGITFRGNDGTNYIRGAEISSAVDGTPGANDMPCRLLFSTTANGSSSPTERMRITSSGFIGIGTSAPVTNLHVENASGARVRVGGGLNSGIEFNDENTRLDIPTTNTVAFYTSNTERARIDSTGRLLIGTSTSITTNIAGLSYGSCRDQLAGTDGNTSTKLIAQFSNASSVSPSIAFARSLGTTLGTQGVLTGGIPLGRITAAGSDGTTFVEGGRIDFVSDASFGTNSAPTRLVFSATPSGSASPVEYLRIRSDGNIGFGGNGSAAVGFYNQKDITGATTAYANYVNVDALSGVTSTAYGYACVLGTQAASFTLANLVHYNASQTTIGSGSTVTNQYGFNAASTLSGATNNYGFYSNLASATGRWNFYANGTADSYFASNNFIFANAGTERARVDGSGRLLIGTSTSIATPLSSSTIGNSQYQQRATGQAEASAFWSAYSTTATVAPNLLLGRSRGSLDAQGLVANGDSLGRVVFLGSDGRAVGTDAGFIRAAVVEGQADGTTASGSVPGRLIFSTTPSGSATPVERLRIDSAGNIAIGSVGTSPSYSLFIAKNITGAINGYGVVTQGIVQSDVTNSVSYFASTAGTQAAAFTLTGLLHYHAAQGTLGAGSTVTNQYGFTAGSSLVGATNNYGFYSNIPSGTGRWNFYTNGTADSYFASNNFIFANGGTEKARFDSFGRLLHGSSTATTVGGITAGVQLNHLTTSNGASISIARYNNDANATTLKFAKSRNTTTTPGVIVQNNDIIADIDFLGDDGNTLNSHAVRIRGIVDGAPASGSVPGALSLWTTPLSGASPLERLRITSSGFVGINTTSPAARLDIAATGSGTEILRFSTERAWTWLQLGSGTNAELALKDNTGAKNFRIIGLNNDTVARFFSSNTDSTLNRTYFHEATGGRVGIGNNNASGTLHVTAASGVTPFIAAGTTGEYARINPSGIMLIGTTTALGAAKLQVNGDAKVIGDMEAVSLNGGQFAGMRNRIINGDMRISQRYGASGVAFNNSGGYTLDRFLATAANGVGSGTATVQQVSESHPAGLVYSLKWTTTNAKATPSAANESYVYQPIEGYNISDLFRGAASKPFVVSFYVKASLTGTYSGMVRQTAGSGVGQTYRTYVFTYTVNSANQWEQKAVMISADTTDFGPNRNDEQGLALLFDMGSGSNWELAANVWTNGNFYRAPGSVRVISTLNATWQVTGVQLEAGTVVTPFEQRPIGQELALCQRYYHRSSIYGWGYAPGPGPQRIGTAYYPQQMRVAPTISFNNMMGNNVTGQNAEFVNVTMFGLFTNANAAGSINMVVGYEANAEI